MTAQNIKSVPSKKLSSDYDYISMKDLLKKIKLIYDYLLTNLFKIFLFGLIGASLGFLYAYTSPIKFVSRITFVVQESNLGNSSGFSSFSGQFGFDGFNNGVSSLLSNDNISFFLKSESLIRETLLLPYDHSHELTFAEKYLEIIKSQNLFSNDFKSLRFNIPPLNADTLSRDDEKILKRIYKNIIDQSLIITKLDRKASIIEVKLQTSDESFSKFFLEKLIEVASDRYIKSKVQPQLDNLKLLQFKVDSLSAVLNINTYNIALSQQAIVDVNPALKSSNVETEIKLRDKSILLPIFTDLYRNLETSKTALSQSTPVIQILDNSKFPLEVIETSVILSSLLSFFVFVLIASFFITITFFNKYS
jgi:hypothetical protein